jgi:hypothetical protein
MPLILRPVVAQVSYGVKGGLNLSDVVTETIPASLGSSFSQSETLVGFYLGAFAIVKLNNRLNLIPELQYTQRGLGYPDRVIRINYLELPLIVSYSIKSLAFDFGPNISYRLSSTVDFYKDFDFGLTGGMRLNFAKKFFVIARYYYGITAISRVEYRNPTNQIIDIATDYNRVVQIGVGYKIK